MKEAYKRLNNHEKAFVIKVVPKLDQEYAHITIHMGVSTKKLRA